MTLRNFFNHTSHSITSAAVILGAASLASRILGLVRDRLLTHIFGAGSILDSYYAAFRIPDFLFNLLVVGALSAAFIPLFSNYFSRAPERAWEFLNRTLSTLGVFFLGIALVCIALAPQLMRAIAPGFDAETFDRTVTLTRIMLASPILMGLSALIGGALQSLKKFLIFALAPILYNAGIIIGILFLVPIFGARGLAFGVVLGAALHFLIQFPTLIASGFTPQWKWSWNHADIRHLLKLMGPRVLALAASQLSLMIITMFASTLGSGAVTTFNLAQNIQYVPIGLIAVSFAVAAFPVMSEYATDENPDGFARTVSSTIKMILACIIPISVLLITLRAQWVRIILGSGAFDWDATIKTADALGYFSLGLLGASVVHVLARAFYAQKNTKIPAICGLVSVIIGVAAAFVLKNTMGVSGLALALSIQETSNAILLWILLGRTFGSQYNELTLPTFYKLCIAGIAMVAVTQGAKLPVATFVDTHTFWGIFAQAIGASIAGLIAFIAVGMILRIEEIYTLLGAAKTRAKKVLAFLPFEWGELR